MLKAPAFATTALAATASAIALAVVLGGCVSGEPRPLPTPSYRITLPPIGLRPSGSATAGCDQARPANGATMGPDDLVLGPLVYSGLKDGYVADPPPEPDENNTRFFKVGPLLPPGRRVTVTIGAAARDFAGISTEGGRTGGYTSVTYASCAQPAASGITQPRTTQPSTTQPSTTQPSTTQLAGYQFWIGGFLLVGRARACVPLEVRVAGESAVRRLTLALPVGACG